VYEAKVRAADGEERDVVFHKATFAGHGGSIGGLVGVILDITEMKRAGERLQLAASVFEHSQQGIAITDENVAIIDVNAAFTAITGYSRAEVLGRNPGFLKSGHQSPDFYAAMWQAIARDGHWQGELWNRRKDGGVYAQLLTISAVCDENGRVRHYVGVFSDITLLKEHQSRLEKIAHYDALTGIPNRVLLGDRMRQAIAQTARTGRLMAICYLDLDGFKPVNDNWGHEAGDALLVEMARRLGECLRGGDTVARLGGDEFVLLLLGLERIEEAEIALRRILDAIAQPFTVARNPVALSASIGVTLYPHDDGDSDTLLRHADQAMYIAKQEGKNRYHLFDPEHDRRTKAHLEAFARIEAALPNREFELYYQPKVNMREGSVVGAEALIRWRHPERGLLSPAEFLPVVENTDVIVRIGDWVIDAALAQMEQWREQGVDLTVSVNIAARHLAREDFIARLAGHFAAHPQVPPSRLELEVLETAAIEDVAHVSAVIDAARDMGVSFALDDFGTGYSSLTYFKRLPASTLKIDQSFVRDMLHDAEDMAIVEGVISLTEVFRRNVIAEGVETIEHGVMLLNLGCELAQGYGIARPMPAAELPVWMRNWRPAPEWAATAGFRWPRDDLPLVIAEYDHRRWVENLAAWVEGGHEAAEPPPLDPAACRFGRWYAGAGRNRYGTLDAFAQIGPIHESIHAIGKRLAELVAAGRGEEARAGVAELLGRRDAMIAALQGLLADGILRR
jgi:diguanylate cyclase (GGDEF)-like protein/PAS domain S-box-containing protein